ncbi:MAG: hypothetical protein O7G88_10670 [bacterium]|nr:hypothetical protein [bacterium]
MIPSQNLTMYVDKKSGTFLPSPPGGKGLGEEGFFLFLQMKSHSAIRQKLLSTYTKYFLVCLAIILISCAVVIPASGSSVNVPLDHWSYRDIDSLIGFGLIQTAILGSKPFTCDEMARLIAEAISQREDLPYRQRKMVNRLLKRLIGAFPAPWLELGGVFGIQFNGKGIPNLQAGDFLDMLLLKNLSRDGRDLTNQLVALDIRITLPFLRYTQIYVEYGGEDTPGNADDPETPEFIFGDVAFLLGLYVPRLTDDGRTTFRFEWMQNTYANDNSPGIWYNSSTFTSGFTFKGRVLGHAAGGNGAEFFWRLTQEISKHATLGGDFSYRRQGGHHAKHHAK